MDLRSNYAEAGKKAVSKFFNAKTDEPVYVFAAKVAGREMFAVLTAQECKDAKIDPKRSYDSVDGRYGLLEHKRFVQEQNSDPRLRATIQYIRGTRQQIRAKEKLEKMERGETSPARPSELPTTKA